LQPDFQCVFLFGGSEELGGDVQTLQHC
jgi:hypothetical protein